MYINCINKNCIYHIKEISRWLPPKVPLRYPGDIKEDKLPESISKEVKLYKTVISRQRKQIKVLIDKHRRHIIKITSLKRLLKDLKNKSDTEMDTDTESIEVTF